MNVYLFDDGEQHWIAAETVRDAIWYFEGPYCGDADKEGYEYHQVTGEVLDRPMIGGERNPYGKYAYLPLISLNQAIEEFMEEDDKDFPALLASSVW